MLPCLAGSLRVHFAFHWVIKQDQGHRLTPPSRGSGLPHPFLNPVNIYDASPLCQELFLVLGMQQGTQSNMVPVFMGLVTGSTANRANNSAGIEQY